MAVQLAGGLAKRGEVPLGDRCGIDRALQVLGNRTAMLLLREAFYGAQRFEQFVRRVGVTEAVASQRLKELVAAGVLARQPYQEPGQRTRQEYVLTEAGHALGPILLGLLDWGVRYVPDDLSVTEATHDDCGAVVHSVLRCTAGHDVSEEEVVVRARRV